jgi:hypothetical protein
MGADERRLARALDALDQRLDLVSPDLDQQLRREHWGHDAERLPVWRWDDDVRARARTVRSSHRRGQDGQCADNRATAHRRPDPQALRHRARRTGRDDTTVLEVVRWRSDLSEAVVVSGFGPHVVVTHYSSHAALG